jgi:hypothetical protein
MALDTSPFDVDQFIEWGHGERQQKHVLWFLKLQAQFLHHKMILKEKNSFSV